MVRGKQRGEQAAPPGERRARGVERGDVAVALAALAAALLLGWQAAGAEGDVIPGPEALAYRGTLERDGRPFEGTATVTVRLFDSESMGVRLCEASRELPVVAGRFAFELPEACAAAVRRYPEAWVVATVDVGDGPQAFPPRRLRAVPYAVVAAAGVPVGGIVPWFGERAGMAPPDGFEPCDGAEITDPRSPLRGRRKPDLRGGFVRGADAVAEPGTVGGGARHESSTDGHVHRWSRVGWNGRGGLDWATRSTSGDFIVVASGTRSCGGGAACWPSTRPRHPSFETGGGVPADHFTYPTNPSAVELTPSGPEHAHDAETVPPFEAVRWLCRVR